MIGAAEPFSRKKVAYKVGPERYSFDRLEREYGSGDASCKAAFRFSLRDLRVLFAAMHFPDEIDTGEETVPSEEAFLILLKRLAYPMRPYQSDIQKFWPVVQILTNCHTCFFGSQDKPLFYAAAKCRGVPVHGRKFAFVLEFVPRTAPFWATLTTSKCRLGKLPRRLQNRPELEGMDTGI